MVSRLHDGISALPKHPKVNRTYLCAPVIVDATTRLTEYRIDPALFASRISLIQLISRTIAGGTHESTRTRRTTSMDPSVVEGRGREHLDPGLHHLSSRPCGSWIGALPAAWMERLPV